MVIIMEKKRRTLRTALLISFASLAALGAAGGGVFAWFAMQNTASVNLSNIAVAGESTTASLKYCTLNYQVAGTYDGYKSNDSRINGSATYDYDSYFLVADNDARQALEYSPGYSFTFAIEINGTANAQVTISKYISQAAAAVNRPKYRETPSGPDKDFALAMALDVYTQVYNHKPNSSELYQYFHSQGIVGNDYFNYTEPTTSAGTAINQPISAGFDATSTAYFLLTMYFSDAPSTWYRPAKGTETSTLQTRGDGSNKTFSLPDGSLFVNSVTLTDDITASGDTRSFLLSAVPYEAQEGSTLVPQIQSVKIVDGGVETETNNYSIAGNNITLGQNPGRDNHVVVTYVATPSSFSFTSTQLTFKNAPLNGTKIDVNYDSELDYYVQDSINGNSNVYEGLTIALTDLLIS